ncbi:MAG: alginate lyase family protein [Rhizobiaceae bacterium]
MTGEGEFSFLGETGSLAVDGWEGEQHDKLWRYNQHYFDDLNARDYDARAKWHQTALLNWLEANPPGKGTGWEPYPTSLRIINWVKWALSGNVLSGECLHSLAIQARWLTNRLEIHLLGNHLFANAKALVFAGLFFEGQEADRWLAKGFQILGREVREQILADGGHFELSTMYHALALEDMFDLHNLFNAYSGSLTPIQQETTADWPDRISKMQRWLVAMVHPDGKISFFNDAAFGIAPEVSELEEYAIRLGFKQAENQADMIWLPDSGYGRLSRGKAVALLDMAKVGPDYLPGHAHADTLSFELSLFNHRVLVNSGTSCYGVNSERLRQRGTAAHNTVIVDDLNSSHVWSGFRVARRAKPFATEVGEGDELFARCSHDGYRHLSGQPVHERFWQLSDGEFVIEDVVSDPSRKAVARFHFHPDIKLLAGANNVEGKGMLPGGNSFVWKVVQGNALLEQTSWHPSFGVSIPNFGLAVELDKGHSQLKLSWL